MKNKDKRKDNETYQQWLRRLFPDMDNKQYALLVDAVKETWFDGLKFAREHQ